MVDIRRDEMDWIVKDDCGVTVAEFRWKDHAELFIAAELAAVGNCLFLFERK